MKYIDLHNYEAFLLDYSEGNLNAEDCALLKDFVLAHPELEIDLEDFNLPYINLETHIADFKNDLKKNETEIPDEELINYVEGNLSKEQKLAFETKLKLDKELASDLESYKKTLLVADIAQVYDNKIVLLKSEEDLLLNNRLVLCVENQLSESERLQLEAELNKNADLRKEFELFSKTVLIADESIVFPSKEELKKKNRVIVLFSLRSIGSMAAAILLLIGFMGVIKFYTESPNNEDGILVIKVPVTKEPKKLIESSEKPAIEQNLADKNSNARKTIEKTSTSSHKEALATQKETKQNKLAPVLVIVSQLVDVPQVKTYKEIIPTEKQNTELASTAFPPNNDSTLNKRNYLALAEDILEEVDFGDSKELEKKSFWKRATQLARKANKLGVKSIDGQEDSENKYSLSFNSFSVGKK